MAYDPVKAHEYYERTKQLKGRKKGKVSAKPQGKAPSKTKSSSSPVRRDDTKDAMARVTRLKTKVSKLQGALSEARAALSERRRKNTKEERKNSDGKTTAEERRRSKEYRDKHRQELESKRKKDGSSGGSSSSSSKSVSDMTVEELETRIIKINRALQDAKRQLSNANQKLGQLAHSELTSEPTFNEHFARFRSAERIPSK